MNSEISERFNGNVARVRHLVELYETFSGPGRGRRAVDSSDVLRAAVVLLHAAVEDLLRSLERRSLPRANAEVLNEIRLTGADGPKFPLGALAMHRGKSVDDLIDASVAEHLERATYNNAHELAAMVTRSGGDPARVREFFPTLTAMMERRHSIVHRADREQPSGSGHHRAKSLSKAQVRDWVNVAENFAGAVFGEIPDLGGPAP